MNVIENWYWQYGIQRGNDPNDPDSALRRITVGGWLDPVSHSLEKIDALQKSRNGKSTIALWGPSQTGKSTLMSRYLDGMMPDGSDSALTWNANAPVRFSHNQDVNWQTAAALYPNTLYFNPFNGGNDASGVATRYTLAPDGDTNVDADHPIEYRLGSRFEVLHAMTLAYDAECERTGGGDDLRQDEFLSKLQEGDSDAQLPPSAEAYRWLREAADVIERSRAATDRFKGLFRRGEWTTKVRPALVSAPQLLANGTAAKSLVHDLLWDGITRLTEFFDRIEALRTRIEKEWAGAGKILMSPAVAALLLDIGTMERWYGGTKDYEEPDQDTVGKLNRIRWRWSREGNTGDIIIDMADAPSGSFIAGESFGLFQALCSEIVVPVRRSVLESGGEAKAPMLALLEKHDLLDFPGLGRKNLGGNAAEQVQDIIPDNPNNLTELDFYKIFKEGRTKTAVYGHIDRYAIDAFVVLNHTQDVHPPKAKLLENGICTWLRSFDDGWRMGNPAPMPIFVNLTFFGIAINQANSNGVNQIAVHASTLIDEMGFADSRTSKWFVTTYPQFALCAIGEAAMISKDTLAGQIASCASFMNAAGLKAEDIEAVFEDDGGTGHMLRGIAARVKPDERRERCLELLRKELGILRSILVRQLPTTEQAGLDARRQSLRESVQAIRAALDKIENDDSDLDFMTVAEILRDLFSAPRDAFEPLPQNAAVASDRLDDWIKAQVLLWFNDAERRVSGNALLDAIHQRELLCTLRDNVRTDAGSGSLHEFVIRNLGKINNRTTASDARASFAVAFGNILRDGTWRRESTLLSGESDSRYMQTLISGAIENSKMREASPYFKMVIEPILARIETLSETAHAGERRPQPGDAELIDILNGIDSTRI